MNPEKRYDNIMHRFKREAEMPIFFSDLTEEQKVLVELIYEDEQTKEKIRFIADNIHMVESDLQYIQHELKKIS